MTEKVAKGVLSGVVKVSGFFTSSVANSKAGKKFFGLLPGEMVVASLDGLSMLKLSLMLADAHNLELWIDCKVCFGCFMFTLSFSNFVALLASLMCV